MRYALPHSPYLPSFPTRRSSDLGVLVRHELHHGCMKLVLVAHRGRAAFEIADIRALVADDQRALELPRLLGVDAEVDRKSTRLNSSHLVISYAVFCLEKTTTRNI